MDKFYAMTRDVFIKNIVPFIIFDKLIVKEMCTNCSSDSSESSDVSFCFRANDCKS